MPYFQLVAIIPTSTLPRPFSRRMGRKAVRCCEQTMTAGFGLPEESPERRFKCTGQESWCGGRRTELRACGPANRRTGIGFGSNGATVVDDRFGHMAWNPVADQCA